MTQYTRRRFLEDSLLAAAAMAVSPAGKLFAQGQQQSVSPNAKLSVAVLGVNAQGNNHLKEYGKRNDVEVAYIVDADEDVGLKRVEEFAKQYEKKPKFVQDLRRVLEDQSVDIVSIATPNHWHALAAIWAMQAGKHVFVEKPVGHNISEGRRIVETARKYNKICQAGTQIRSNPGVIDAVEYVRAGKIGEVKLARGLCYKPRTSIGARGTYYIPLNVDYDLWSGPAPIVPLSRVSLHYDWHWQWPYGDGDLGNQGIHHMDIARWGLGEPGLSKRVFSYGGRLNFGYGEAGETPNTMVVIHDYDDKTIAFEVRGLKTDDYKGAKVGVIFYGSEGYVVIPAYDSGTAFDPRGNIVKKFSGWGDHFGNFLNAVRSGNMEDLNSDILQGHISTALCHMGNISYRLGKEMSTSDLKNQLAEIKTNENALETFDRLSAHLSSNGINVDETKLTVGPQLIFDPESETFPDNEAANKFLTSEYRKPFAVPSAGEV
ncbi:MAG TPA: Gfo/Idh/MocA family oxidoreductase [Thermoguttaceae bacterium]